MSAASREPPERSPPSSLPATSVALAVTVFAASMVSVALATAIAFDLSTAQTMSWIAVLYGLPGVLSLILTYWYRRPLFIAWNIPGVAFLASQAGYLTFGEIIGASMASGAALIAIGLTGWNERLSGLIPAPVVFAIVAGTVLPFVIRTVTALSTEPVLVGATILAFLLSLKFVSQRVPPILLALVTGVTLAAAMGHFNLGDVRWSLPNIAASSPELSLGAMLTVTPVLVILFLANSYIPATVILRGQDFEPPERTLIVTAGAGTLAGSLFGPALTGMGALVVALTAGPDAGEHSRRYWSVYGAGVGMIVLALGAGIAAQLPDLIPIELLVAVAGLALVSVLGQTLSTFASGPLRFGPVMAFAVTLSGVEALGLGSVFWALVLGSVISFVIDRHQQDTDGRKATGNPTPS
jgi:benzoate membrane transport protein